MDTKRHVLLIIIIGIIISSTVSVQTLNINGLKPVETHPIESFHSDCNLTKHKNNSHEVYEEIRTTLTFIDPSHRSKSSRSKHHHKRHIKTISILKENTIILPRSGSIDLEGKSHENQEQKNTDTDFHSETNKEPTTQTTAPVAPQTGLEKEEQAIGNISINTSINSAGPHLEEIKLDEIYSTPNISQQESKNKVDISVDNSIIIIESNNTTPNLNETTPSENSLNDGMKKEGKKKINKRKRQRAHQKSAKKGSKSLDKVKSGNRGKKSHLKKLTRLKYKKVSKHMNKSQHKQRQRNHHKNRYHKLYQLMMMHNKIIVRKQLN